MPGNDKTVKFVFEVDQASVNNVKRAFTEIVNASKAMADALKTAGAGGIMGGGNVGARPAAGAGSMQAAAAAQKNTIKLDVIGPDAAKNFKDFVTAVKAGANDIKTSLGPTIQLIASLNTQMAALKASAGGIGGIGLREDDPFLDYSALQTPDYKRKRYRKPGVADADANLIPAEPEDESSGEKANKGQGSGLFKPVGGGLAMAGRIAGMALVGATAWSNEERAGIRGMSQYASQRNQIMGGLFDRAMSGDYRQMRALLELQSDEAEELVYEGKGAGATGSAVLKGIGGGIGSIFNAIGGAIGGSGTGQTGGALGGLTGVGINTKEIQDVVEHINTRVMAQNLMEQKAWTGFSQQLSTRVAANRLMGLGLIDRDELANGPLAPLVKTKTDGNWADTYGAREAELMRKGYTIQEQMSAVMQMNQMAGFSTGGSLAGYAMAANAIGAGGFSDIMGAAARATGDKKMALMMAQGAAGRGDIMAGLMAGQAIVGSGFDPMGTTSGLGTMMAYQAGFGFQNNAADFRTAQQMASGLQAGTTMTMGTIDPWQRAMNTMSAISARPDIGVYGQDYLATGMNMKQMLDMASGKVPLTTMAEQMGLSSGDIKKQLMSSLDTRLSYWVDTGANTPMERELRKIRESGKGWTEYLQGVQNKDEKLSASKALTAFFGRELGEEAAAGVVGLGAGIGATELTRRGVGRSITGMEAEALEDLAKRREKEADALQATAIKLSEAIQKNADSAVLFSNFGSDLSKTSEDFIGSLGRLSSAIENAIYRIDNPGQSVAPPSNPYEGLSPKEKELRKKAESRIR